MNANISKKIVFDLLNNAKDSLRQAVELIATKDIGSDHARLKHAITASAHCVELLLKERLRRINPAFVWDNVDKYPSLQANTVTVKTAISRLKTICNIEFSLDDEVILTSLRATRNAIEHYEWRTSEKEAKTMVGNAISFALEFAQQHLDVDLSEQYRTGDTWTMLLDELIEFSNAHGERLEARLRTKGEHPTNCDQCGAVTVPIRGGSCELCGHLQSIEA